MDDINPMDLFIGKRLRCRRRLLGMTQQHLADVVGVRFQQIQKYECGGNRISAARLWRLSEALEVEVGYFYKGAEGESSRADALAETLLTVHAMAPEVVLIPKLPKVLRDTIRQIIGTFAKSEVVGNGVEHNARPEFPHA